MQRLGAVGAVVELDHRILRHGDRPLQGEDALIALAHFHVGDDAQRHVQQRQLVEHHAGMVGVHDLQARARLDLRRRRALAERLEGHAGPCVAAICSGLPDGGAEQAA